MSRYHLEMTQTENSKPDEKKTQLLEEICENTRAIRRVTNRILDHLHEYGCKEDYDNDNIDYDPDSISWQDLESGDDMYM
jgi:hypothetical protein